MSNPRVYFTIQNDIFYPYRGQYKELDDAYRDENVRKLALSNLTANQKAYISRNNKKAIIYYSEKYDFDSTTKTFVFHEIPVIADEEDITRLFTESTNFNANNDYIYNGDDNSDNDTNDDTPTDSTNDSSKPSIPLIDTLPDCPSTDKTGFYVDDLNWKYLVRNIKRHKPTILIGPTGTGKTELILMACKELGVDCEVHDMGSMQDPLTDLIGCHRIKGGNSTFDYAKFVSDVQKPGVILLDELSRAPLMTNNILFPCLDSRRELPLAIADSEGPRSVKVHPDCVFIATANIGTEYSGTQDIDMALMNRFLPLKVGYMPYDDEINVLIKRCKIDEYNAKCIVTLARKMRQANKEGIISLPVSTRENIAIAEMVADGFSLLDAVNFVVCNKFNDEDMKFVKQIMMTISMPTE